MQALQRDRRLEWIEDELSCMWGIRQDDKRSESEGNSEKGVNEMQGMRRKWIWGSSKMSCLQWIEDYYRPKRLKV